jgi:hypothetical protein
LLLLNSKMFCKSHTPVALPRKEISVTVRLKEDLDRMSSRNLHIYML